MNYRQTTVCGHIATCLCKVTARLQAAMKTVLVSHSVPPLHVGQTLTVNTPTHLQLHLGGFHLRQTNSSLVPPTV